MTDTFVHRPYGNPVPYKKYWKAYEDIMRSNGGRPHWAKVCLDERIKRKARYLWYCIYRHMDKAHENWKHHTQSYALSFKSVRKLIQMACS